MHSTVWPKNWLSKFSGAGNPVQVNQAVPS